MSDERLKPTQGISNHIGHNPICLMSFVLCNLNVRTRHLKSHWTQSNLSDVLCLMQPLHPKNYLSKQRLLKTWTLHHLSNAFLLQVSSSLSLSLGCPSNTMSFCLMPTPPLFEASVDIYECKYNMKDSTSAQNTIVAFSGVF